MVRFLRFAASFLFFPFVWALCLTLADSFLLMPGSGRGLLSAESIALFAGLLAFPLLWPAMPASVKIYILGHELTHALWALVFGARVGSLKVGSRGGSVAVSKSNVWITLAPYFFPFWTAAVGLLALAVRAVMCFVRPDSLFPAPWLWMFAVGFTWSFHACFTVKSLMQTQPDVQEYGRVFSWTLILTMNLLGILLWIVCTTDAPVKELLSVLANNTAAVYLKVVGLIAGICSK